MNTEKLFRKMNKRLHRSGKQAVLAGWPFIEQALSKGYDIKTIWEVMAEENMVDIAYNPFRVHVKHIQQNNSRYAPTTKERPLAADSPGPIIASLPEKKSLGDALADDAGPVGEP